MGLHIGQAAMQLGVDVQKFNLGFLSYRRSGLKLSSGMGIRNLLEYFHGWKQNRNEYENHNFQPSLPL